MSRHSSPLEPCPPGQFDLQLPPGLEEGLSPEKSAKITKIQVRFAEGVARLIARSYAEVSAVLEDEDPPVVDR